MRLEDVTSRMLAEIEDQAVKAALEEVANSQSDAIRRVQEIIAEALALKTSAADERMAAQRMMDSAVRLTESVRAAEAQYQERHEKAEGDISAIRESLATLEEKVNSERALRERADSEVASLRARCKALEAKLSQPTPQPVAQSAAPITVNIPALDVVRGPEGRIRSIVPRT